MKPLIYVASEYTSADPLEVQRHVLCAREIGAAVNRAGGFAVVPHNLGIGIEHTLTNDEWYQLTEELMARCDGVVVRHGAVSKGVLAEVARARAMGLPMARATGVGLREFVASVAARGNA